MSKLLQTIALLFSFIHTTRAQDFEYAWSQVPDSTSVYNIYPIATRIVNDTVYSLLAVDADSVETQPGPGENWIYDSNPSGWSNICFLTRSLTDGTYLNSVPLINDGENYDVYDFEIAPNGTIALMGTGYYSTTSVDFDQSAGYETFQTLTSSGESATFLAFYDLSNSFLGLIEYEYGGFWPYTSGFSINDIAIDESSQLYATGMIYGTTDMDFTAGVDNIVAAGNKDCAITKIDLENQVYVWTKNFGSTVDEWETGAYIEINKTHFVVAGTFRDVQFDADPGLGDVILTKPADSYDWAFISLFDTVGNLQATVHYGQANNDTRISSVEIDENQNITVMCELGSGEVVEIDPLGTGQNAYTAGAYNLLIANYDSNLELNWHKVYASPTSLEYTYSNGIQKTGSYLAYGFYSNPSNLTVANSADTVVSALIDKYYMITYMVHNTTGEVLDSALWKTNTLDDYVQLISINVDENSDLYVTGSFNREFDFNYSDITYTPYYTTPNGMYWDDNAFLCKMQFNGFASNDDLEPISLLAFPNPCSNQLTIQYADIIAGYEIYSSQGQVILTEDEVNQGNLTLDLTRLAPGIYFLSVTNEKGERATVQFVRLDS